MNDLQPRADGVAVARLWARLQRAAVDCDAFTHADQAPTAALVGVVVGRKNPALVEDLELERGIRVADEDAGGSRLAVSECVGQCFLDDAVGGEVDAGWEWSGGAVDCEVDRQAGVSDTVDELFDLSEAWLRCARCLGRVIAE